MGLSDYKRDAYGRYVMPNRFPGWEIAAFVVLLVVILGLRGCWAEHVYGDWTCAFSECRREVKQ